MFYPVRVLDPKGKIKKVVSSKELSQRYWNSFHDKDASVALRRKKGKKTKKPEKTFDLPDVYGGEN